METQHQIQISSTTQAEIDGTLRREVYGIFPVTLIPDAGSEVSHVVMPLKDAKRLLETLALHKGQVKLIDRQSQQEV